MRKRFKPFDIVQFCYGADPDLHRIKHPYTRTVLLIEKMFENKDDVKWKGVLINDSVGNQTDNGIFYIDDSAQLIYRKKSKRSRLTT